MGKTLVNAAYTRAEVVATGLEPGLAALGQLRNGRLAALPLATLLCSVRLRLAASRTAGVQLRRPIDGNDVLYYIVGCTFTI